MGVQTLSIGIIHATGQRRADTPIPNPFPARGKGLKWLTVKGREQTQ